MRFGDFVRRTVAARLAECLVLEFASRAEA